MIITKFHISHTHTHTLKNKEKNLQKFFLSNLHLPHYRHQKLSQRSCSLCSSCDVTDVGRFSCLVSHLIVQKKEKQRKTYPIIVIKRVIFFYTNATELTFNTLDLLSAICQASYSASNLLYTICMSFF